MFVGTSIVHEPLPHLAAFIYSKVVCIVYPKMLSTRQFMTNNSIKLKCNIQTIKLGIDHKIIDHNMHVA